MTRSESPPTYLHLSRRESQIMDTLYRLGEASVSEVVKHMQGDPTYNTVRNKLTVLEEKGYVQHRRQGKRFVYVPTASLVSTRKSVARHMVKTFFDGSFSSAALALLGMSSGKVTLEELDELQNWISKTRARAT